MILLGDALPVDAMALFNGVLGEGSPVVFLLCNVWNEWYGMYFCRAYFPGMNCPMDEATRDFY
jgi:hypothetical protein